jgi:predicted kinase
VSTPKTHRQETVIMTPEAILSVLAPHLERHEADARPVVVMLCGIAGTSSPPRLPMPTQLIAHPGAGKSTISRALCASYPAGTFERLSIDGIIASKHGIYGIDYPASADLYAQFQSEADGIYDENFDSLLREGRTNVILDRSFYSQADRIEFKTRIQQAGARWVLVYLDVARDELWRRIQERRAKGVNADSALDISEALFAEYWNGFEVPEGEGEIRMGGE